MNPYFMSALYPQSYGGFANLALPSPYRMPQDSAFNYISNRQEGLGTSLGGTAGGLIGSIWGPIGNMVGKQIGMEAGGGIQEFIEKPDWDTVMKYLLARPMLGGQMGINQFSGFLRPLFSMMQRGD